MLLGLALIVLSLLGAQTTGRSVTNRVGCAQRAETSSPTVFNDPRFVGRDARVVVGPVELRGVGTYASPQAFARLPRRDGYFPVKVALVVQARRSLELTVRGAGPKPVLLEYTESEPSATLIVQSCPPKTPARSRPGVVGSGTVFTGLFDVPVAECVTLRITDRTATRVWRTRLPLGHKCSA
ncbi:MAG TPA: hypothetical protein VF063_10120 [Gaiellaceae bacterium]